MNSRPVWIRGKFEALGSHGPWIGLGMAIVLIVWLKLLTTAGELIQRDLEYPLFASDVLGDFYPMLASDGRIALGHMSLTPVMGIAGVALKVLGGTPGWMIRWLLIGQSLVAFGAMYFLFQLLLRPRNKLDFATYTGAFIAGLFYALNPWAIARGEHLGLLIGYSLIPVVLGLMILAVQQRSSRMAVGASLCLCFAAASPHYLVFISVLLVCCALCYLSVNRSWQEVRLIARIGSIALLTVLGLEMFLIMPTIVSSLLSGGLPPDISATSDDLALNFKPGFLLRILTLTNNSIWLDETLPTGQAMWIGQLIGLIPIGALGWTMMSGRFPLRARIMMGCLALTTIGIEVLVSWEQGSGISGYLISHVPGGRALREPDKLSGLLVIALAWGVGGVASVLVAYVTNVGRPILERLAHLGLLASLGLTLLVIVGPSIQYFLWSEGVVNWVPRSWPTGYDRPIEMLRATSSPIRLIIIERDERVPVWDETILLRQPVTRSLSGIPMVGWRHAGNSIFLSRAFTLSPRELGLAIESTGANRLLVVHDTPEGSAIDAVAKDSNAFEPLAKDMYATLYNVRSVTSGPTEVGTSWEPVYGMNGTLASAGHGIDAKLVVVADTGLSRCPPELELLPRSGVGQSREIFPPCILPDQLLPFRPDKRETSGWESTGGSAAEITRWLQALARHDIAVKEYDFGLGVSWIEPGSLESRTAFVGLGEIKKGTAIYLRALVGNSVAKLEVEAVDASGTVQGRTSIEDNGDPRLAWVPIEMGDEIAVTTLRISASEGLGAVNLLGLGGPISGYSLTASPRIGDRPLVHVTRDSRTQLEATITGASDPFALVISENYSPIWRAKYPGGEAKPFSAGYARMGFIIPVRGNFDISIEFVAQRWHNVGLLLSGLTLVFAMFYILKPCSMYVVQLARRAKQTTEVP